MNNEILTIVAIASLFLTIVSVITLIVIEIQKDNHSEYSVYKDEYRLFEKEKKKSDTDLKAAGNVGVALVISAFWIAFLLIGSGLVICLLT